MMKKTFSFIINQNIKLNDANTINILRSYLTDYRKISIEKIKDYLNNVNFKIDVFKNIIEEYYTEQAKIIMDQLCD